MRGRVRASVYFGLVLLAGLLSLARSAFYVAPGDSAVGAPDFAALDAYVEAELRAAGLPGMALAIVQGDRIAHLRGFGVAGPSGRPVTAQTPFLIGWVSKSFSALAVMQLVEAGEIELDAPVRRYLPWFQVVGAEASARITVRSLLNHTSGLSERSEGAPPPLGEWDRFADRWMAFPSSSTEARCPITSPRSS